ncbi:HPC2 and ubinuclein domain-containing protein [Metschnikowia aff. pulcherrima]|uniref:HPC2 and ubinuclein domain-containing protein n=1 Tax=Metschnikowia aff. pulcherrima TaxID=2163413 RepID=A0A4P6XLX5_9ASCO|nr:HPC2 and ubinuclein domain-containing protein [Metschnikowia aff. pulcherrima]
MANGPRDGTKHPELAATSLNLASLPSPSIQTASPAPTSLANLVSHFQTSIGIPNLLEQPPQGPAGSENRPQSTGATGTNPNTSLNPLTVDESETRAALADPQNRNMPLAANVKDYQQVFDSKQVKSGGGARQSKFSKTSISSLINLDENAPAASSGTTKNAAQAEKRKRASPKTEPAAKRSRADPLKKTAKAEPKTVVKIEPSAAPRSDSKTTLKSDTKDAKDTKKDLKVEPKKTPAKPDAKSEPKKTAKAKKKTPELVLPSQEKPSIHPTMTTEKSKYSGPPASVPAPSFIAMDEPGLGDAGNDEKEKLQLPVIALDVPLLDPKNPRPGQAEVVVNVMRLAEEKYGWAAVHPEARSTFDLMEDVLDDEEDGDEEEDEEVMIVDEKGNALKKKDDGGDKKKKKVPPKVNRKVGKYDFEDPFIDDAELQWEEEITTTKEGFFVYWGPLVDERQPTKKGGAKSKK